MFSEIQGITKNEKMHLLYMLHSENRIRGFRYLIRSTRNLSEVHFPKLRLLFVIGYTLIGCTRLIIKGVITIT
ncbi:hypothetical protein T4D_13128, partial [Trichinella pseudospiralis]